MNEGSGLKPAPLWLFVGFCGVLNAISLKLTAIGKNRRKLVVTLGGKGLKRVWAKAKKMSPSRSRNSLLSAKLLFGAKNPSLSPRPEAAKVAPLRGVVL